MTTGRPELTKVTLNSIDVSSFIQSWSQNTNKDNSTIKGAVVVLAKAVTSILTVDNTLIGKSAIVQRGVSTATERYVLRGEVLDVSVEGGRVLIKLVDEMYTTTKKVVTKSFDKNIDSEAGKYSEIFKTLINDYTDLTADATSVQDSGTVNVLTKFVCRAATVFDRLKALADAIGWQFYYNSDDDLVYFEPQGYTSQTTIATSSDNFNEIPRWKYIPTELYNVVEIRGAQQEVETTESGQIGVTSGYSTTSIQLLQKPVSVKVYADSSNPPTTLRTGGIESSTSSYDYQVDQDNKLIEWSSTYTPGGSDYVQIDYSYYLPVPVVVNDSVSESAYGTKKKVLHKYDILNVNDAENYATEYLNMHKDPILKTVLQIQNIKDLEVGQTIQVTDDYTGIDDEFIIVRVKKSYPYRYDEIEVVSKIIDSNMFKWEIDNRVKRLEEQNTSDNDLLLHVISQTHSTTYERRYIKLLKTTLGGDVGVYGHPTFGIYGTSYYGSTKGIWGSSTFGIWGTMKWGSGGTSFILGHSTYGILGTSTLGVGGSVETTESIVQGNNIYQEYIYDEDFYSSSNSTATWDTTNKELTFTGNDKIQTSTIFKGATYNYFTVTLGTTTGTLQVEITADNGTNWQTVTLNTRTAFTNTGTQVKLKISETVGSAATITPTGTSTPAIYCKIEE